MRERKTKNIKFEWYVLNDNFNASKIEYFNIFRNSNVHERTNILCEDYKKKKMTFDEFVESLQMIIMCEEWSRCEYEILVSGLFWRDKGPTKIDCYTQVIPNIRILAKYVLETYYPRLKITEPLSPSELILSRLER